MKKITEQKDVLVVKLQALYDVEKELEKALPKLAKAATDPELTQSFTDHLEETKNHAVRLEQIFEMLGEKPAKNKIEGIRGIVEDGTSVAKINSSTQLKDTMLASAARYAEHYEIAGYMSAILEAEKLGLLQIQELLNQTLDEEKNADKKLEAAMEKNFQSEIQI
jgi:ferritin-like metal-binding protein YciE